MHKHTPGPWRVDDRTYAEGARGHVVCNVELAFTTLAVRAEPDHLACPSKVALDEIGQANARLIAAAPELLEACRFAADVLADLTTEAFRTGADKPIRDVLAAVIAKAEG